jgi:DNA topoisomerase IB
MPRLRRSDCAEPGIGRRRRGRGFDYPGPHGDRIEDPRVLERIAELAIPPAWREVWICLDERGHLQATGVDAAGRKQYLYHEQWRAHRDRAKFESMLEFARSLPRLRRRASRHLACASEREHGPLGVDALTQPVVLACAVRLLDLGLFRIGSEDYAEQNGSYGLTTMLREHVTVAGQEIVFDYPAKSGQRRVHAIAEPRVVSVIAALKRRRQGAHLLAYRGPAGEWVDVHADEVNAHIKTLAGGDFTAKDFRTWNATVLASVALAAQDRPSSRAQRERTVRAAMKTVAAYLGNTAAVARTSYVDPRVVDRYRAGATIAHALHALPSKQPDLLDGRARKRIEQAVVELLE